MIPKPTREAVAESYKRVTDTLCTVYAQANLDVLWQAYLSQGEELVEVGNMLVEMSQKHIELQNQAQLLLAENQALKASMEADYIERQAKHIQELVKANEALKAFIGNMHVSIATPFFDSKLNREGQP